MKKKIMPVLCPRCGSGRTFSEGVGNMANYHTCVKCGHNWKRK